MYICVCKAIRVSDAVEVARSRPISPEALVDSFGLDDDESCGRCANYKNEIAKLISIELNKPQGNPSHGRVDTRQPLSTKPGRSRDTRGRKWFWLGRSNNGS